MCARSRTATRLYRLQRESLLAACRAESELAMHMLSVLSQALYTQVNKVDWLTSSSASERLANYLLNLQPGDDGFVHLPLSQRESGNVQLHRCSPLHNPLVTTNHHLCHGGCIG